MDEKRRGKVASPFDVLPQFGIFCGFSYFHFFVSYVVALFLVMIFWIALGVTQFVLDGQGIGIIFSSLLVAFITFLWGSVIIIYISVVIIPFIYVFYVGVSYLFILKLDNVSPFMFHILAHFFVTAGVLLYAYVFRIPDGGTILEHFNSEKTIQAISSRMMLISSVFSGPITSFLFWRREILASSIFVCTREKSK